MSQDVYVYKDHHPGRKFPYAVWMGKPNQGGTVFQVYITRRKAEKAAEKLRQKGFDLTYELISGSSGDDQGSPHEQ